MEALKSFEAFKMYSLISIWKDKGELSINEKELSGIFGNMSSPISEIIMKAHKDLFQKSDVYFEVISKPSKANDDKIWVFKIITQS